MEELLQQYRNEIDNIDQQLYALYKQRLAVSKKVGLYKYEHNIPILDQQREREMQQQLIEKYEHDDNLRAYIHLHQTMMRVSRNAQYVYEKIPPIGIVEILNGVAMECSDAHAMKTNVLIIVENQSSLTEIISQFQYECIDILNITVQTLKTSPLQCQIQIEFEGGVIDDAVQRLLQRLESEVLELYILGNYGN